MRVITNERHVQIHKYLATATSLIGVVTLFASIFLPFLQPGYGETPPIWLVLIAIAFAGTGLRLSYYWLREPLPHDVLDQGLKGFPADSALYHYRLPVPHVLIAPAGVFTLTVKPQTIGVHVEKDGWRQAGTPIGNVLSAIYRQDSIGNPGRLAARQAQKLQTWLDKHLPDNEVAVQPIVVFTSPQAALNVEQQSEPPTFYADKRKPSLKTAIRAMPKANTLSPEQISTLEAAAGITTSD